MESDTLAVTIVGSFKKDQTQLQNLLTKLKEEHNVISPRSLDFTSNEQGFVKTEAEVHDSVKEIEDRHLNSILKSDCIVLFAPEGYVGLSGALEAGFAYANGIPIFATESPSDVTISEMINGVGIGDLEVAAQRKPGKAVDGLQNYYARIAQRRGWASESARDTLLLLTEELGELARAVRKEAGLKRDSGYEGVSIEDEIADVQLYLVHLANSLGVNLSGAVDAKEFKNTQKFRKLIKDN